MTELSVDAAYIHRFYRNFVVNDRLDVRPEHYNEFCVTAPADSRLGSVSGREICGQYDLNPAQFSLTQTLRTRDTNFGTQKESWQGMDVSGNFRRGRLVASGGVSVGTAGNMTNNCFVVDSPQQLYQCEVTPPWQAAYSGLVTVGLPLGIDVAATYRSRPGPEILANLSVANKDIANGSVRFLNPARTGFSGGSATVSLLAPGNTYGERMQVTDLRLSWGKKLWGSSRALVTLDIANLFNENTILSQTNTYGSNWLRPGEVLLGRVIKPGVQIRW
jgi:hypothetical protein